jgi:hypothetical protein
LTFFNSPKKHLLSLTLIGFLSSCGSSSEGETPVEPIALTFSLSSVLINDCGVEAPFTDIELLLQDSDWQTIEVYKSDENGLISFSTFDENINYTLVAKNQAGNGVEGLNIESYYQAKTVKASRYVAQYDQRKDQSTCQCITQDVELTHRPLNARATVTSSLDFESFEVVSTDKTIFKNVEACREVGESWPLSSFAIIGDNVIDETVGVATFSDNFDANVELVWPLSAFDVSQEVELTVGHQAFNSEQLIQGSQVQGSQVQGNNHFPVIVGEDDLTVQVFNSHAYISEALYRSKANLVLDETSSFFGSIIIESSHNKVSSIVDESFSVMASTVMPDIDVVNFSEIKADGSYDYSAVSGYPMAVISFELITLNPTTQLSMPTKWTNYGPEKGLLAISAPLTGYEKIIDIETTRTVTDTLLLKSASSNNYQDYMLHFQANLNDDFDHDLQQYHIRIAK